MANYHRLFIENSIVFLTITTQNRKPVLVDNIDLLRDAFKYAKSKYNFKIIAIVVLPDHIHMLLHPENIKDYPKIIYSMKFYFSSNVNINVDDISESKIKKGEKGIWQRRYYEHTIIDENDLSNHIDYIHYNPLKHSLVNSVKNWKYSSFEKFVKKGYCKENWGGETDFKHIKHLSYE